MKRPPDRRPSTPVRDHRRALAPLAAALLALAGDALAHGDASGIVRERMEAMEEIGDHAKAVGAMLKGKTELEPAAVRAAAEVFVRHGRRIPALFPDTLESREGAATEALPAIWEEPERFAALVARFVERGEALTAAAAALETDMTLDDTPARVARTAFFRVADACRDCHRRYRLDD